ncbi:MAG: putative low-complexity protein [Rickettsiales bacterium]|jgi:uncharacterized protein YjbI with pentapeptide repeats|nr:putative low-complexity protein [Rickettsiales bacterium]
MFPTQTRDAERKARKGGVVIDFVEKRKELECYILAYRKDAPMASPGPDVAAWFRDKLPLKGVRQLNIRGMDFAHTNLHSAEMAEVDLLGVTCEGANAQCADMSGCILMGANLANANFRKANLAGADLRGSNVKNTDLSGANLCDADIRDIRNLHGAILHGAILKDMHLKGMDLSGMDLGDANMEGADLREANLRGVNLRGANVKGADFKAASLKEAVLTGVSGLKSEQLALAFHIRTIIIDPSDAMNTEILHAAIALQSADPQGSMQRVKLLETEGTRH